MGESYIRDTRELNGLNTIIQEKVNRAVVAAAFKIRDNMRSKFKSQQSLYKKSTSKYSGLAEGISVGKARDGKVKIHALGTIENYHTYKTRFFVGGTKSRYVKKKGDKYAGHIQANNSIDKGLIGGEEILTKYINTALDDGK